MRIQSPLVLSALLLASCGGGDPPVAKDAGAVALYSAPFFRRTQPLSLMRFEGGLLYGLYQSDFSAPSFPQFAYAGFFVVEAEDPAAARTTFGGFEFDFDRKQVLPVTVALAGQALESVHGTLRSVGIDRDEFDGAYAEVSSVSTLPGALSGSYGGYVRSTQYGSSLQATLDNDGKLSVTTPTGCKVEGTLRPRPVGSLYDAEATVAATCPSPVGRYSGHAFQSLLTRNVYVMLTSTSRDVGLLMHLYQPPP